MVAVAAPRITADELKRRLDEGEDIVIADVRRGSWHRSDVKMKGAIRASFDELVERLPPGAKVVTYCT